MELVAEGGVLASVGLPPPVSDPLTDLSAQGALEDACLLLNSAKQAR